MGTRIVLIQNPAQINLKNSQLQLKIGDSKCSVPVEDIAVLILESCEVSLTSALMSFMMEKGVVIVTCDSSHLPNGILNPFVSHSRSYQIANMQVSMSDNFKKKLWRKIVQIKISNQGECLNLHKLEGAERLLAMAKRVSLGDKNNLEAQSARYYWRYIFGDDFKRSNLCIINSALNYGYAIIRSFVARSLVSYGLLPVFGINHANDLNSFNLADDVIEVFRPLVDLNVKRMELNGEFSKENSDLTKENRRRLVGIACLNCKIQKESISFVASCDRVVMSLVSAIKLKDESVFSDVKFPFCLD